MSKIDTVMTRSGDQGETSLVDGSRIAKSSQRVRTYGTVDELNSVLGLIRCEELPDGIDEKLLQLQHELFDLGGELATPAGSDVAGRIATVTQSQIDQIEDWLQIANQSLQPAQSFVLPGGSRAAACLHLARTVTRRCERELVALIKTDSEINPLCLKFLNRLSDLFFVWARFCNDLGRADIHWQAGPHRE